MSVSFSTRKGVCTLDDIEFELYYYKMYSIHKLSIKNKKPSINWHVFLIYYKNQRFLI
jgi:hypothetical protein